MTLRIAQDARYEGEDWWTWSVWLEGTAEELDRVRSVNWFLHSTFPDPVREVTNRKTKFKLKTAGWGEFRIRAEVTRKKGTTRRLIHDLVLDYPRSKRREGRTNPVWSVYLSYSSFERESAESLKKALTARGVRWADPSTVASTAAEGETNLRTLIMHALTGSDAVLALRTAAPSAWAEWEIATARARGIPIIQLAPSDEKTLGEALDRVAAKLAQ